METYRVMITAACDFVGALSIYYQMFDTHCTIAGDLTSDKDFMFFLYYLSLLLNINNNNNLMLYYFQWLHA